MLFGSGAKAIRDFECDKSVKETESLKITSKESITAGRPVTVGMDGSGDIKMRLPASAHKKVELGDYITVKHGFVRCEAGTKYLEGGSVTIDKKSDEGSHIMG